MRFTTEIAVAILAFSNVQALALPRRGIQVVCNIPRSGPWLFNMSFTNHMAFVTV